MVARPNSRFPELSFFAAPDRLARQSLPGVNLSFT
jgi:hypothetical protein